MSPPFTTSDGRALTFFRGMTGDGAPWVLAYEGGNRLGSVCRISGLVPIDAGYRVLRALTFAQATELRALLPWLERHDVGRFLTEVGV